MTFNLTAPSYTFFLHLHISFFETQFLYRHTLFLEPPVALKNIQYLHRMFTISHFSELIFLLPNFMQNLMLIHCSRFLLLISLQQYNRNTQNFLYCSAVNGSSGQHLKKVSVGTCLNVLKYKCLSDSFPQQGTVVILVIKLTQNHMTVDYKRHLTFFRTN